MPEHTPGPWRAGPKQYGAVVSDSPPPKRNMHGRDGADVLAHYGGYVVAESVMSCDMPVIIAAPDLLKACEAALRWMGLCTLDDEQETRELLVAAIAKAHGEESTNA